MQIQIQIHTKADTKLLPFYRWHIQIHSIVRKLQQAIIWPMVAWFTDA